MKTTFKKKMKEANVKKNVNSELKPIMKNYKRGLWSNQMLKIAVTKGAITEADYKTITGENYI